MADTLTKARRSAVMASVRGSGNKQTETALIHLLRQNKISGWRRNQPMFGKPDFFFQKFKLSVFVDGCFWHGCPLHCRLPATNRAYWLKKISRNKSRDHLVTRTLCCAGLRVLRIWEHELARENEARLVRQIQRVLKHWSKS